MKTICVLLLLVVWSNGSPMRRRPSGRAPFIPIIRHVESSDNEGSYSFEFEDSDGSKRSESGALKQVAGQPVVTKSGHFSFVSPEGIPFEIRYTSDENGFHPVGSHIPKAPIISESNVEEYEHSYEDYHHQSSSSYLASSSYSPASLDSVNSPYEEENAPYSHIEYGENEFMESFPTVSAPIPSMPIIPAAPTTVFPTTTTTESAPLEHIVTHPTSRPRPPTSRPRPPSMVSIPPPVPSVSLPLPSPAPTVSVPKPNRPTIIEAPLVPILVGPAPVASKTFVQTPEFTLDFDASKTMVRIGNV